MPEGKKKSKRKALSQKTRFEVFKRDQFTCQYCGRKAPDVVLQVDHIIPVAKGGKNEILNLVTSCVDCNSGKSDRKLDDASVVEKQRHEMELRQERLEQIRMMGEWQRSLVDIQEASLNQVNMLFKALDGGHRQIDPQYLHGKVAKYVDRFGLSAVLEALRVGTAGYRGDALKALQHLGGICANMADPELNMKSLILSIVKKKFTGKPWGVVADLLDCGRKNHGISFLEVVRDFINEDLYDYDDTDKDWNMFCTIIKTLNMDDELYNGKKKEDA